MTQHDRATAQQAVIYCRVSSARQVKVGDGLASQETRCREYARSRGYEVVRVYADDISGSALQRRGMEEMIGYVGKNRAQRVRVLIDDISRLARSVETHAKLRQAIALAGGVLESPSVEFGEDSDSRLIEYILATVAEHQRGKNGEVTRNRMRARITNGYYSFMAPVGYKHDKVQGHAGKVLVRDEPVASIIAEALEGYATDRFSSQAEVRRFLESQPDFPKSPKGYIPDERAHRLLRCATYAGYVSAPDWGVPLRLGHHQGLISFETWKAIQDKLDGKPKTPARADINEEFPLRNFVVCGDCGNPLTACWSKSSTGVRHPYYLCFKVGCASKGKSIRREKLEGEFERLLQSMRPTEGFSRVIRALLRDLWDRQVATQETRSRDLSAHAGKLQREIDKLLDLIVESPPESVRKAYEKRIQKLEEEKALATERAAQAKRPARSFDETLRTVTEFLSNPWILWASPRLSDKRMCLKLAFAEKLEYVRKV